MRSRAVGSRMSTTRTPLLSSSRTDGNTRTDRPAFVASSESSSTSELLALGTAITTPVA